MFTTCPASLASLRPTARDPDLGLPQSKMDDAILQARHRLGVIHDHLVDRRDEAAKAFYAAAASGDIDTLKAVLVRNPGIDIEGICDGYGARDGLGYETALNAAVRAGHVDVVSLLLNLGASPNADLGARCDAQPVLHTLLRARPPRIDMVRLLLDSGANPNGRAFWADRTMLEAGDDRCFGADICSHEALFDFPSYPAPFDQVYFDVLDLLIAYGFDIHALPDHLDSPYRHYNNFPPLGLTGQPEHRYFSVLMAGVGVEYLKEAISRGAAVPEKELFRAAARAKNPELIRYLVLDLGFRGFNIEMLAQISTWPCFGDRCVGPRRYIDNWLPSINLLLETLPDHRRQELPIVLCAAIQKNNIDCVRFWLDHGVDVNGIGRRGIPPLLEAASVRAFRDVFELLLERGADVNARVVGGRFDGGHKYGGDTGGYNAFHFLLCEVNNCPPPAVLGLLFNADLDPDARNDQGDTPLLVAARQLAALKFRCYHPFLKERMCAFVDMVKNINAVDRHGRTALHLLAYMAVLNQPSLDVFAKVLIQAGIDTTLKDKSGHTAGDLFRQEQGDDCLQGWIEECRQAREDT
ncbi:hypothetical protein MAPG_02232 [Magnaporthiopsis poae ATCC 64411]|uniref:Ankyrin repeat protein n=1 Tax=Magnaporthiopsis poae (strain ATCC 64411 / 73-15) TaxID=644358 RepID=A0A0C4DQT5_MAGP6|nr:hypothetical protein MAPG_02232 [Magnaporthiopsis poae ATCC 64411]